MINREENLEQELPASTLRQKLVEGSLPSMSLLPQDTNAISFYDAWQNILPRLQGDDQSQVEQQQTQTP